MYRYVTAKSLNQSDLIIYQYGTQVCPSGHFWGPGTRDHFLMHFIHSGKGIFVYSGITYHLEKGDAFIIYPNSEGFWQADTDEPWAYSWIGFNGIRAVQYLKEANLTVANPVFSFEFDESINFNFLKNIENNKTPSSESLKVLGILYLILSKLVEAVELDISKDNMDRNEMYIRKVIDYVENNYSKKILISDIANYIGLDRSYLCSLFKQSMNTTLKRFLTNRRVTKACELMVNEALSIADISKCVGYEDPVQFIKAFKTVMHNSPNYYRIRWVREKGINLGKENPRR